MRSIWLFNFTAYSYCQGSEDVYEDKRLISTTLPCEEWEARTYLCAALSREGLKYDFDSITCLNINVTNS